MSLLEAQEWLNQRPDSNESLYAVMVQLDGDGEYQLIWIDIGHLETVNYLRYATWFAYDTARGIAKRAIGDLCRFDGEEREIACAFIVEKGEDYRVIEEVDIDAPES